jgi:uncharacterized Fe-S cluster protein YjdI
MELPTLYQWFQASSSPRRVFPTDLSGIGYGVKGLAHGLQAFGDEVCVAFTSKTKHHGRTHIKGIPLAFVVPRAAPWQYIPDQAGR